MRVWPPLAFLVIPSCVSVGPYIYIHVHLILTDYYKRDHCAFFTTEPPRQIIFHHSVTSKHSIKPINSDSHFLSSVGWNSRLLFSWAICIIWQDLPYTIFVWIYVFKASFELLILRLFLSALALSSSLRSLLFTRPPYLPLCTSP